MKKFTIIAVALCVGFMLAVPAMALEIDSNGLMRVRGYSEKGYSLDENSQSTSSWYDMRLRVNTNLRASDEVWVSTRFRAFNRTMGEAYTVSGTFGTAPTTAMFQWERAWINVKTPVGLFRAGRMIGGAWGLSVFDNEGDEDRIRFDTGFGAFKTGFIIHKLAEVDKGDTYSSADANRYTWYGLYPSETTTAGLLLSFIDDKTASDQRVGNENNFNRKYYVVTPFFKTKFGPIGVIGEVLYIFGDHFDYHAAGLKDVDKDSLDYMVEGSFDFGGGSAFLGFAHAAGQENKANSDKTSHAGFGDDWEMLYILTGSTGMMQSLGGVGNFSKTANDDGLDLLYAGANFKVGDGITLGVVVGTGTVDEPAATQDDEVGFEVDLKLGWKFFDGALVYSAVAAYLSAGDYWEGPTPVSTTFDDSMYALYHKIQVNF